MTTAIRNLGNEVIISIEGRLDTATSPLASAKINSELKQIGNVGQLTLDASKLEYISSSGLRILLSLSKQHKGFRVKNVQPVVYEVLETTSFTKIMSVERALRELSVEGCEVIGIGGVGTVYRLDDDTIIKVFREGTTIDEVRREITMSKEAFVLGMPTAISFDIVRVLPTSGGSPERFGLVYELLRAETLSSVIKQHPEQLEHYARKYADLFLQMHSIEVPAGRNVSSATERELQQVLHIRRYFSQENIDMLFAILESIPAGNRLLHMDLQTKNVMVQDGELMLIDMGEVGYGHPILDMAHAYSAMISLVGDYDAIIGMPRTLGQQLWNIAIDHYFDGLPADLLAQRKAQIEVASCVRKFSWLSLSDSFPEQIVKECQALFSDIVVSRYGYIMEVCKTFNSWEL